MKKYKFKLGRTNIMQTGASDLEAVTNEYAKNGWRFNTTLFFKELSCFMIIFEQDIQARSD